MLSSIQGGWLGKAMIHRSEHKNDYMIIDRAIVRNTALSDGAVRLLLFLLSCSDEFEFNVRGLASILNISVGAVSARVQELEQAGYIKLTRQRNKGQLGSFIWDVFETPCSNLPNKEIPNKAHLVQFTESRFTEQGNSEHIRNTNLKEIANKEKVKKVPKKAARFVPPTLEEVRAYCQERGNSIDPQRFFDYYSEGNWKDAKGNPVKNWKQKVITWEKKDEGKRAKTEPINENPFTKLRREEGYES